MLCLVTLFILLVGGVSAFNHFLLSVSTSQIIHHPNYQLSLQPQTRYTRHSITMSSATTSAETQVDMSAVNRQFRIRTITCFVTLKPEDFQKQDTPSINTKINKCSDTLRNLESSLSNIGYEVQTVRVATNPFGEWLTTQQLVDGNDISKDDTSPPTQKKLKTDDVQERLNQLDSMLEAKNIQFCSLGPSLDPNDTINICPIIVATSGKFSCSAKINAGDIEASRAAAQCMKKISTLGEEDQTSGADDNSHIKGGLGNFRFCAASCIECVPFFPGARATSDDDHSFSFAIGLENGGFACTLLEEAKSIGNIKHVFDTRMREELLPIQDVCMKFEKENTSIEYLGIDTSFNPSLDEGGSIAEAIESLEEVRGNFGGTGSLSAAAAITTSLQSIKDIKTTGYSGLMLPVLEDQRLAELANKDGLTIQQLLCISSVCGVGIDTVPIPGNVSEDNLSSLILDVAALACRWNKPLSCRVFPVPGKNAGEMTTFDSPYMVNSRIFKL